MALSVEKSFEYARERYAEWGVDVDEAMERLAGVPLSLHCWQGDDVAGFETPDAALTGGGIAVTGHHPGRARNIDELREDLKLAYSLIPGRHRLNLHSIYGDFRGLRVERNLIGPEHFQSWIEFARERKLGLDFNCTCFSHPLARSGFTLSALDESVRKFWIEHIRRCREIGAHMGRELGAPCVHNLWIPDGAKDVTVNRMLHRELLRQSLDEIYARDFPREELRDSLESKLFGIGSESFVVGSHEFYMGYAAGKPLMLCLDMGHFHPTESVADKISSILLFHDELLVHVSRGVRWDSDHVVVQNDELRGLMEEIIRARALSRVRFALDFFDAQINRVGAWVAGARATLTALLYALLEPASKLRSLEKAGDRFLLLALIEEAKTMPFGAVWEYYCLRNGVPARAEWISVVSDYENRVLRLRG